MVMMVLVLLSSVVVARTLSGLKSTRSSRKDFSAALANADAGLSDALFRFDQLGTRPAATFCVGANAACTLASVPGAPGVQYTARRVDDNTYTVLSKGLVNGQPHAIQATVTRSYLYPFRDLRQDVDHLQRQHAATTTRQPASGRSRPSTRAATSVLMPTRRRREQRADHLPGLATRPRTSRTTSRAAERAATTATSCPATTTRRTGP